MAKTKKVAKKVAKKTTKKTAKKTGKKAVQRLKAIKNGTKNGKNHPSLLLGVIRSSVERIFDNSIQSNQPTISPKSKKHIYSLSFGPSYRVEKDRPAGFITIEREIVLRVAAPVRKRGRDAEKDLQEKCQFVFYLEEMIVQIEKSPALLDKELSNGIFYKHDTGVVESSVGNDKICWQAEITFRTVNLVE